MEEILSPVGSTSSPVSYIPPPVVDSISPPSVADTLPSLKPNLAIILVGLGFTFMLVCAFALFAKCMNPHFQRRRNNGWNLDLESPADSHKDGPGVDPSVINALPLVFYKRRNVSLKRSGSTTDPDKVLGSSKSRGYQELESECAVCLSVFEDGEQLRQLPECRHAFHPDCVDSWLGSHPSCPLCRRSILSSQDKAAALVPQESQRLRIGDLSDAAGASGGGGDADLGVGGAGAVASPADLPEIIVIDDQSGLRSPSPLHLPAVGGNAPSSMAPRSGTLDQVGVLRQSDKPQEEGPAIAAVPVLTEGLPVEGTNLALLPVTSSSPNHTRAA